MVLDNRDLNQVTWEQRVMAGDPKFEASQDVPVFPFALCRVLGLRGIRVDKPEADRPGLGRSAGGRSSGGLEALTDPDVPTVAAAHHF